MDGKKFSIKKILNILIAIILIIGIYFIIQTGDFQKLRQIKSELNYWGLIGVLFITIINILLSVYRWYLLLLPVKPGISFSNILTISISAVAIDFTGPGKLGTPTKALLLRNMENIKISQATPSFMFEILFEYAVAALLMLGAAWGGGYLQIVMATLRQYSVKTHFILIGLGVFILVMLFFKNKIAKNAFIRNALTALKTTQNKYNLLIFSLLVTIINYLLTFFADMWLYQSLGFKVSYFFIIFSGCFAHFVALLSPLPGGLGIREVSTAYLFKLFNNLGEIAAVAVFIRRLMTYLALGLLFVSDKVCKQIISMIRPAKQVSDSPVK